MIARDRVRQRAGELGRVGSQLADGPAEADSARLVRLRDDVKVHVEHGLMRARAVVLQDVERGGSGRGQHGPADAWQHAANRTPHGKPIKLQADDFDAARNTGAYPR